jgi:hypothetical protein
MKKLSLLILVLLLAPVFVRAEIFDLVVDMGSNKLNAVEGTIVLPMNVIPQSLSTGHSGILLWVKEPIFNPEDHTLSFAGVTPGGFSGRQIILSIEMGESASIRGGSIVGYRNDGQGTPLQLEATLVKSSLSEDVEAPEPFVVSVARSKEAFDGQSFISFSAQDKNSGIDHYELATTWFLGPSGADWRKISSPYILSKVEKFQRIHVRAIDKENNFRTVSTGGPYWYITLAFGLIMVVCFALFIKRSFSRFS